MSFLTSLHGGLALLLLCTLIFVEEAGVPLPLLPGDLLLIAAGVLIASGNLVPVFFIPLAMGSAVAGALAGYAWARRVGSGGLVTVATRLRATAHLERASRQLEHAGAVGILVGRLIPGLRIYTNLVAGALRLPRRTFIAGLVPSVVIWTGVFTGLGVVVGVPIQGALRTVDRLLLDGGLLVVAGAMVYVLVRRVPSRTGRAESLAPLSGRWRTVGAAIVDVATLGSVLTGLYAIAGVAFHLQPVDGWYDALGAVAVAVAAYLVVTRGGAGLTAGEALFGVTYKRVAHS